MTDETREALDVENQAPTEGTDTSSKERPAFEEATATTPDDQGPGREEGEPAAVDEPADQDQASQQEVESEVAWEADGPLSEESEDEQESEDGASDEPVPAADESQVAEQGEEISDEGYEQAAQGDDLTPTVESVIEAILFATDEPLTESKLANIVETTTKQVRDSVKALNKQYEAHKNAFRIEQIAGGYQMLTQSIYNNWLKKMLRARSDTKLSPAAMETLAIIAYKQPIIRADIEAIRGVAVGEVIRSLMYKGLVKIVGRAEILGRPMLYGTTRKFLEVFGLNSLKDLPKAEELKNPDRG
jgi:segregation and condensation protein B